MSNQVTICFTGTRKGMTVHQKQQLEMLLLTYKLTGAKITFLFGACIGADRDAYHVAIDILTNADEIVAYPSNKEQNSWAESCYYLDDTMSIEAPLVRNKEMVKRCSFTIAAPDTREEQLRSGTWATVRYTRQAVKPIIILTP